MTPDEPSYALAAELGRALLARRRRATVAESCTGGLLAGAITSVAGSSDWFDVGYVTYSNAAKVTLLGVPDAVLASHGAVSEETARAMALGALAKSGADIAAAVTGIAGPSGGTPEKPVGLVYIALAAPEGPVEVVRNLFFGGREQVKYRSSQKALDLLRRRLRLATGV